MRVWIASEENPAVLLRAQTGFPELFTDQPAEGKSGPFPLSYLRKLKRLFKQKSDHSENCDWEDGEVCVVCEYYRDIPNFPIPHITIQIKDVSREIFDQIRSYTGDGIPYVTYFPYQLYEIVHDGQAFYLGYVDILEITLCTKEAVFIDE